jgi:quercetin 2,3-dioxygenase
VNGVTGPVRDVVTSPEYLDVSLPAGKSFTHSTFRGHTVFAYVIGGKGVFENYSDVTRDRLVGDGHLVFFADGDQVTVLTEAEPVRFLLISGKPIGEPIAWYGPIVMNTQEELQIAFEELEQKTFIKAGGARGTKS